MRWNADFEIASACIQLVFLCYFLVKKYLPTRQNRAFLALSMVAFGTVVLDVVSAYISSYPHLFGRHILLLVNTLYMVIMPIQSILFFVYVIVLTGRHAFFKSPLFTAFAMPAIVTVLMALSSPVTGFCFFIDENLVYHHGSMYIVNVVANCMYLLLTLAFVIAFGKEVRRIERTAVYLLVFFMTLGATLQVAFFRWTLLSNAMTGIAIVIFYVSMQNAESYIDKESGMFNRYAFETIAAERLEEGRKFSCITLEIKEYAAAEILYGAEKMEGVLREIGNYLKRVNKSKRIYRINANLYLIPFDEADDCNAVIRGFEKYVEKSFFIDGMQIDVKPYIVFLPYWHMPSDVFNLRQYIQYVRNYRNTERTVIEIDNSIIEQMEREHAVDQAVERTIANESVQIYLQPIYSIEMQRVVSCEALVRIFDEKIGFIEPGEFITRAEKTGNILRLGLQIFDKVCRLYSEEKLIRYGVKDIHVNVSTFQFLQETLPRELIEITDKYGLPREHINLEIKENVSISESNIVRKNMEMLSAAGFTFSLDGYGTGYSNTASIISLNFDNVKIERSLFWSYANAESTILPDIMHVFEAQGWNIIVEGVEDREKFDIAVGLGIKQLQGFYFSRALPVREFISCCSKINSGKYIDTQEAV